MGWDTEASNTESTFKISIPLLYEQLCPDFVLPLCSTLNGDINISFFKKDKQYKHLLAGKSDDNKRHNSQLLKIN